MRLLRRDFYFQAGQAVHVAIVVLTLLVASAAAGAFTERPRLTVLLQSLQNKPEVTKQWGATKGSNWNKDVLSATKLLLQQNQSLLQNFAQTAKDHSPFLRGEIDDEKVLADLIVLEQLFLLKARLRLQESDAKGAWEALQLWLTFAADMPYEEASLVGLRLAPVLRSLVFDELESWQRSRGPELATSDFILQGLLTVRSPWPVDRVILTEAQRLVRDKGNLTARKVAQELQKNAYQTAEEVLSKVVGPRTPALQFLIPMWRTQDVESMRNEITRLHRLQLQFAISRYSVVKGKPAVDLASLIQSGLLTEIPLNYVTGQAFTWAELTTDAK